MTLRSVVDRFSLSPLGIAQRGALNVDGVAAVAEATQERLGHGPITQEVRHPPRSGWLGEWGRFQCEAVSNVELARQGAANRGFPEFHLLYVPGELCIFSSAEEIRIPL